MTRSIFQLFIYIIDSPKYIPVKQTLPHNSITNHHQIANIPIKSCNRQKPKSENANHSNRSTIKSFKIQPKHTYNQNPITESITKEKTPFPLNHRTSHYASPHHNTPHNYIQSPTISNISKRKTRKN